MYVFIWARVKRLTKNHHQEGGLVIFAASAERALEMAKAAGVRLYPFELPNEVRATFGEEAIYLMPDAGCC